MAKLILFVSATIVGIFISLEAVASPKQELAAPAGEEVTESAKEIDSNMAVTTPPESTRKAKVKDPGYYPYHQALTVRLGYESKFPEFDFENWMLGFQYLFPKFLSPKLEAGADLIDEGNGHLHIGMRTIYREKAYFRPSLKWAIDHLAEPRDGLATLTKIDNYFARGSATLEYVFWNPVSVRLEAEVLANLKTTRMMYVLGLSRGW